MKTSTRMFVNYKDVLKRQHVTKVRLEWAYFYIDEEGIYGEKRKASTEITND